MSKELSQTEGYMKIILGQSDTTKEPPCWKCNGRKGYYSNEVRELRSHDKGTWHVCTACNGTGKEKADDKKAK